MAQRSPSRLFAPADRALSRLFAPGHRSQSRLFAPNGGDRTFSRLFAPDKMPRVSPLTMGEAQNCAGDWRSSAPSGRPMDSLRERGEPREFEAVASGEPSATPTNAQPAPERRRAAAPFGKGSTFRAEISADITRFPRNLARSVGGTSASVLLGRDNFRLQRTNRAPCV